MCVCMCVCVLQAGHEMKERDVVYLRTVLLDGFMNGQLPRDSPIFSVISKILKITPQEMEAMQKAKAAQAPGYLASFLGGGRR